MSWAARLMTPTVCVGSTSTLLIPRYWRDGPSVQNNAKRNDKLSTSRVSGSLQRRPTQRTKDKDEYWVLA